MCSTGDDYFSTTFCPLRPSGRHDNWLVVVVFFAPSSHSLSGEIALAVVPLGSGGALSPGIILTAVITGLVNVSNTYGAIRGTDVFSIAAGRGECALSSQLCGDRIYDTDNRAAGSNSIFTVCFIHWFINPDRRLLAAFVYLWQRYLPAGGTISGTPHATVLQYPLPVEVARVMLVSYLPLLSLSAGCFGQQITFTARNVYRLALPLSYFLMALPLCICKTFH